MSSSCLKLALLSSNSNIFLQPVDQLYEANSNKNNSSRFFPLFNFNETESSNLSDSTEDFLTDYSEDTINFNFMIDDLELDDSISKSKINDIKIKEQLINDWETKILFFKFKQLKKYQAMLGIKVLKEYENDIIKKCFSSKLMKKIFA